MTQFFPHRMIQRLLFSAEENLPEQQSGGLNMRRWGCHTMQKKPNKSTRFHFLIFSESLMSLESSEQRRTAAITGSWCQSAPQFHLVCSQRAALCPRTFSSTCLMVLYPAAFCSSWKCDCGCECACEERRTHNERSVTRVTSGDRLQPGGTSFPLWFSLLWHKWSLLYPDLFLLHVYFSYCLCNYILFVCSILYILLIILDPYLPNSNTFSILFLFNYILFIC